PTSAPLFPYTTLFRSLGGAVRSQAPQGAGLRHAVRRTAQERQGISPQGQPAPQRAARWQLSRGPGPARRVIAASVQLVAELAGLDRKSTRLNSSHVEI